MEGRTTDVLVRDDIFLSTIVPQRSGRQVIMCVPPKYMFRRTLETPSGIPLQALILPPEVLKTKGKSGDAPGQRRDLTVTERKGRLPRLRDLAFGERNWSRGEALSLRSLRPRTERRAPDRLVHQSHTKLPPRFRKV